MNRTALQNRALHLACSQIAQQLNAAGYDFNDGKVIRIPVSFTQDNVKEYMFKRVMNALHPDIESTTELTTKEVQEVYEELNRYLAENWGVSVPWPSQESLSMEAQRCTSTR